MRALLMVGILVLAAGVAALFVAFPHTENHQVNAGPMSVDLQTKHDEKLPTGVAAALIIVGAGMAIMGARSKA
jgi:hypothetical protein